MQPKRNQSSFIKRRTEVLRGTGRGRPLIKDVGVKRWSSLSASAQTKCLTINYVCSKMENWPSIIISAESRAINGERKTESGSCLVPTMCWFLNVY